MKMRLKQFGAAVAALAMAGAGNAAFNAGQYTNGVPQTVNGVTFVLVTDPASAITRITNDTRWTANNVYVLDKLTFVAGGATLVIEPGTLIRGERPLNKTGTLAQPADPGTLICAKGSKIIANGTAESPIIMTSIDDPYVPGGTNTIPPWLNTNAFTDLDWKYYDNTVEDLYGGADEGGNAYGQQGWWGALGIAGQARVAQNNTNGTTFDLSTFTNGQNLAVGGDYIEGFQSVSDGAYGGTDDDDNSGVYRFISIRYSGFVLTPNNELNGVTFGGVGRGTTVEFMESFNSMDDGFEWFGGCVNAKYLAALFAADEAFDYDEGYRGNNQFLLAMQGNKYVKTNASSGYVNTGRPTPTEQNGNPPSSETMIHDSLFECDGAEPDNGGGRPYSIPKFYNVTGIGRGTNETQTRDRNGLRFKLDAGGKFYNAIFVEQDGGTDNLSIEDVTTSNKFVSVRSTGGEYGFSTNGAAATEEDLLFRACSWYDIGNGGATTAAAINRDGSTVKDALASQFLTNAAYQNTFDVAPGIVRVGRVVGQEFDPRLTGGSAMRGNTTFTAPNDGFFTPSANFRGAFRDNFWLKGWSLLDYLGVNTTNASASINPVVSLSSYDGTNVVVSFDSQAGVYYSIERSLDGKAYTPLTVIAGAGAGTTVYTNVNAAPISGALLYRVLAL